MLVLQTPANGSWSMTDKKFFRPAVIETWCIAIFERETTFKDAVVTDVINQFAETCRKVGKYFACRQTVPRY